NETGDYITQPEKVPRSFFGKAVREQEKTALQISDYFNYFKATLSGICRHFDIENADNNYIPNPIGHILHKVIFSINILLITERAFVEWPERSGEPIHVKEEINGYYPIKLTKIIEKIAPLHYYLQITLQDEETEIQQEHSKMTELITLYKNRKYIELLKLGSYIDQKLQYTPTQYWYHKKITKYQFSTKRDREIYKELKRDFENYTSKLRQIKNFGYIFDSQQAFYLHFDRVTTLQLPNAYPETTTVIETQTVLNKIIAQQYLLE
ncbi:626_t:CDS:2, partial [Racocetra persica]